MKISFLTGNKRIYSDGQEIYSGGSVLETEFNHTWPQDGHVLRIETSLGVTSDTVYNFLVDSVTYKNFHLKSGLPSDVVAGGAGPTAAGGSTVKGFGSSGTSGAGPTAAGGSTGKGFGSSGSSGSSGAGSTGSTGTGGHRRGSSGSNGSTGTSNTPQKAVADPFAGSSDAFGSDPFGSSNSSSDPFASSGSGNTFDPFGSAPSSASRPPKPVARPTPPPAKATPPPAASFDMFGDAPSSNSSNDPFGNSSAPQQNAAFDPFGAPAPAAAAPAMDLFSAPMPAPAPHATTPDPFAAQTEKAAVDFSNLTFTPPKAPQDAASAPAAQAAVPAKKDAYGGLVNLDLGGGGGAQRRPSLGLADCNNPPLNSMMSGGRPASMQIPQGSNPFANNNNNMGGVNGNNPFQNMNSGGQPPGGANRRQSMAIRGNDVASMYNPQAQQQTTQKSSLDSLNWKV